MSLKNQDSYKDAIRRIRSLGGQIRMVEALKAGISRRILYSLRDRGTVEQISRGFYRLSSYPSLSSPDIIAATLRAPRAVICLVSALSFYGFTTQIPHAVDIAILKGTTIPRISTPPVRIHRLREPYFSAGIENHTIDKLMVRIYDPEKTLVDCFRFRNQLGMDVVLEALGLYRKRKPFKVQMLMNYARICRVDSIILPYLEATR